MLLVPLAGAFAVKILLAAPLQRPLLGLAHNDYISELGIKTRALSWTLSALKRLCVTGAERRYSPRATEPCYGVRTRDACKEKGVRYKVLW